MTTFPSIGTTIREFNEQTAASDEQLHLLAKGYRLIDSLVDVISDRATVYDMTFAFLDIPASDRIIVRYTNTSDRRVPLALCYREDGRLVQYLPDGIRSAWTDHAMGQLASRFEFEFGIDRHFCWVPLLYGSVLVTF